MSRETTFKWMYIVAQVAAIVIFVAFLWMLNEAKSERSRRIELEAELRECDWEKIYALNEMQKLYNKGAGYFIDSVLGYDTIPVTIWNVTLTEEDVNDSLFGVDLIDSSEVTE